MRHADVFEREQERLLMDAAGRIASIGPSVTVAATGPSISSLSIACGFTDGGAAMVIHGSGFDPASVAEDRRGIADSIIGRLERHGGTARVESRPGAGTEVVMRLPRRTL